MVLEHCHRASCVQIIAALSERVEVQERALRVATSLIRQMLENGEWYCAVERLAYIESIMEGRK